MTLTRHAQIRFAYFGLAHIRDTHSTSIRMHATMDSSPASETLPAKQRTVG